MTDTYDAARVLNLTTEGFKKVANVISQHIFELVVKDECLTQTVINMKDTDYPERFGFTPSKKSMGMLAQELTNLGFVVTTRSPDAGSTIGWGFTITWC
jgi:hypothetical protein